MPNAKVVPISKKKKTHASPFLFSPPPGEIFFFFFQMRNWLYKFINEFQIFNAMHSMSKNRDLTEWKLYKNLAEMPPLRLYGFFFFFCFALEENFKSEYLVFIFLKLKILSRVTNAQWWNRRKSHWDSMVAFRFGEMFRWHNLRPTKNWLENH